MRFHEVVIAEIQGNRSLKILKFLAECICEASQAAAMHPQRVILLFNVSVLMKIMLLFDAILRHQLLRVGIILWHAGGGDFLIQREELGEQIFLRVDAFMLN